MAGNTAIVNGTITGLAGGLTTSGGQFTFNGNFDIDGGLNNTAAGITFNGGDVRLGGNLSTNGNLSNLASLAFDGMIRQYITINGQLDLAILTMDNAAGVVLSSGILKVGFFDFTEDAMFYLQRGDLYVDDVGGTGGDSQYFVTVGNGMLYRLFNNEAMDIKLGSDDINWVAINVSTTGNGYVGLNVFHYITYNGQKGAAPIRGATRYSYSQKVINMTIQLDSGDLNDIALAYGNAGSPGMQGPEYLIPAIYQYNGAWIKVTNPLSSGTYGFGNAFGVDFRGYGVLDYPTEGWEIDNIDNTQDWPAEPILPYQPRPTNFALIVPPVNGFMVSTDMPQGFSLVGSRGGDITSTLSDMPVSGENGVNVLSGRSSDLSLGFGGFRLLDDVRFDNLESSFGIPSGSYEEEEWEKRHPAEAGNGEVSYLEFEEIDAIAAINPMFKSTFDATMDKFLAC